MDKKATLLQIEDTRPFDELSSTPMMIVDKDDTILFMNEAACSLCKTDKKKATGNKCYKIIPGLTNHCLDCLGDKMPYGSTETFSCHKFNGSIKAVTYLKSQFVMYKGQLARTETISDLPTSGGEEKKYTEALDFEVLLHKMSMVLMSGRDEEKIEAVLKTIAEYFDADRAYVYKKTGDKFEYTHRYAKEGGGLENNELPVIQSKDVPEIIEAFNNNRHFLFPSQDVSAKKFSLSLQPGVERLLFVPLFDGASNLYGFYGLENETHRYLEDYALSSFALNLMSLIHQEEFVNELSIEKETGLPTEQLFWITVKEKSSSSNKGLILCEFDFFNFQGLNHFYGTDFGDELIAKTASALLALPFAITACHLAERDQFIVLFEGTVEEAKASMSELGHRVSALKSELSVRFYLGFAEINTSETERQIKAKISVTHRYAREHPALPYVLYSATISKKNQMDLTIVNSFPKALENEEFVLYVQPKYDMDKKAFYGGEVLVRWIKDGQIVSPGDFIPVLEKNGLITRLDRYVFLHTLAFIRKCLDMGAKIAPLAINLSRVDFLREDWALSLLPIIDVYKVPHDMISFEITESAYVEKAESIIRFLSACKKIGIAVAMDDFGSGESSLNSLKNFDISCLKMDYKFFRDSPSLSKKNSIIASVIGLANALKLDLVVEGIDNQNDATYLYSLGAYKIQGFFFAKPKPIEEFIGVAEKAAAPIGAKLDQAYFKALQDPNSTLFKSFTNSILPSGVFRFDGSSLTSIMENEAMHALPFLSSTDKTGYDLVNAVDPSDKECFCDYIAKVASGSLVNQSKRFRFVFPDGVYNAILKGDAIHREGDGSIIAVQILPSGQGAVFTSANISFSYEQIAHLYDHLVEAVAFVGDDKKIHYFNQSFASLFPLAKIGGSCEAIHSHEADCLTCPLKQEAKDTIMYLLSASKLAHFISSGAIVDGNKGRILTVSLIGAASNDEGNDKSSRMEKALFTIVSSYSDINLLTGSFTSENSISRDVEFANGDGAQFDQFVKKVAENYVAEEDVINVLGRCSLESLRKASKELKEGSFSFRIKNRKQWQRVSIAFNKDVYGNYHASIFSYDCTSDYLKDYDSLTGVLNRNEAKNRIDDYVLNHYGKTCYLGILDLDSFKSFNDRYGHPLGDEILEETAKVLLSLGPGFDFISRLGGDEFSLFYHNEGEKLNTEEVAKTISSKMATIGKRLGFEEKLDASVGFAEFPLEGFTYDDLYHRADERLYEIKDKKKIA